MTTAFYLFLIGINVGLMYNMPHNLGAAAAIILLAYLGMRVAKL